ncbi:MAG: hypothetical protein I8H76_08885 [Burkholderiales bacterium]|nr:hypothetical protein [Burkholderiales bacterium]MBH2017378.1 hypothetical protein [Burkholderiales bacterium]
MSKDSGSFLRKVVRFVANPTTDWAELDAPPSDPAESDYAKTEIKAMIERKRRNDFVRKRELDMLRKIRREGLNPDAALAMGSISNLDPESRPQSGARSDSTVKAKIDEIELQMVGASGRNQVTPSQAAALPTVPGGSVDLPITAPSSLAPSASPPARRDTPQVSQAVLDAARAQVPRMPGQATPIPPMAPTAPGGLQVVEMAHDPELDEAVIAFANADFDQCEQCLLTLVQPGAVRHHHAETWMVLFDLYRALDLPHKFDNLAVSFAQQFGVSAPQWYSLPQRVAQHMDRAEGSPAALTASSAPPPAVPSLSESDAFSGPSTEAGEAAEGPDWDAPQPGWIAPAVLDQDGISLLRVAMLQLPRPWRIDWQDLTQVTPQAAHQLSMLLKQWAREPMELIWAGSDQLLRLLEDATPTGSRDIDPAYWMLRLDVLRLVNQPVQFDEVAIDYCVTYEQSPPSWEATRCTVREQRDAISAPTAPMSHVSEVTTSFVESQVHQDIEFVQVAALNLSGQLVGDIGSTLGRLDDQLGASISLEIDCSHLLRVDFIAAGDLLNWVLARRSEERHVIFLNPHRLVALFFGAMGINEHATVKLQTV